MKNNLNFSFYFYFRTQVLHKPLWFINNNRYSQIFFSTAFNGEQLKRNHGYCLKIEVKLLKAFKLNIYFNINSFLVSAKIF